MAAAPSTALDLWRANEAQHVVLRSGCDAVDELLGGGFRSGLLTEICGEASAGKTQLCLQLLLQCGLPLELGGLGGSSCYVCTEGVGAVKRLHDLATSYAAQYGAMNRKRKRDAADRDGADAFLDGIFVEQIYTADELVELLQTRLPTLLEEQQTKLVVIDSIAAVFRLESTATVKDASERARAMFYLANCMRILSAQYRVVFVLTNQVTGDFRDDPLGLAGAQAFKPALGLSWANCINQRLVIRRGADAARRRLEVAFAPHLAAAHTFFEITRDGIRSTAAR